MTTDLVTCEIDATLRDAVEGMLRNAVGSTVVREDGVPTGVVTETDVLDVGYETDAPFSSIPVRKPMSVPLITIDRHATVRKATQRMRDEGVKKLVVVEDLDALGIVTTEDVIHNYHQLKSEIQELVRQEKRERDRW